jgi:hypothetical protein
MALTREDLHAGLHRFATRHDLDRFATKQELSSLREETIQGFSELRLHVDEVAEALASKIGVMIEGLAARSDQSAATHSPPARAEVSLPASSPTNEADDGRTKIAGPDSWPR